MSRTPIVRPIYWPNVIVNLLILGVFIGVGWLIDPRYGVAGGAAAYLAISILLRATITRHHRRGVALCRQQRFEQAISEFEKSLHFFQNHRWIDDWRAITLLAAGMPYREMALVSLGFCYGQIGNGVKARSYYEQALQEFPGNRNGMAQAALRLMDAAQNH
jgi:Flp pilus assembly protein TadD